MSLAASQRSSILIDLEKALALRCVRILWIQHYMGTCITWKLALWLLCSLRQEEDAIKCSLVSLPLTRTFI